jgi:hypothetical protein
MFQKIDFKKLAGETYDEEYDDNAHDGNSSGNGDGDDEDECIHTYANKHIRELTRRTFEPSASLVQTITDGSTVTAKNLFDKNHPLTIDKAMLIKDTPQSIGMKLPKPAHADGFTIREIGQKIGMTHPISVMDVRTQDEMEGWIFSDMVDHFEDDDRKYNSHIPRESSSQNTNSDKNGNISATKGNGMSHSDCNSTEVGNKANDNVDTKSSNQGISNPLQHTNDTRSPAPKNRKRIKHMSRVLNQISLEFSPTPFAKFVRSPKFVRDIDWIDSMWPYERRKEQDYPRVQYYCLTSTAGCYTDFHVDFGGTSVWYHILSGKKIFLLMPASENNLALYEKWMCRKDQNDIFFPDMKASNKITGGEIAVTGCVKIELNEGETFIIPSGWLHAVYTPVDSLVIGGNFLHGLDIKGQMNIHCLETRTRVPAKFRFPSFVQLMFYAGKEYYKRLRDPLQYGIIHENELSGLTILLDSLKTWNRPGGDADRFGSVSYVILECFYELQKLFEINTMDEFFHSFESEVAKWKVNGRSDPFALESERKDKGLDTKSASSPKPKIKLSIKRKLQVPPSPTPSMNTATLTKEQEVSSPTLQLKLKNPIHLAASSSDGKKKENTARIKDDITFDSNSYPEDSFQITRLSFPSTDSIPKPRSRICDLKSSHKTRDDDEWLPDTELIKEATSRRNTTSMISKRTESHKKMKKNVSKASGPQRKKSRGGNSRSRLMKKLKF